MALPLLLASQSAARRAMLAAAGVPFDALAAGVDEEALTAALLGEGQSARTIADALAEAKALRLSSRFADRLVLGSDQVLETGDGALLSKPADQADAKAQLGQLSGKPHRLWSAAVLAEGGRPIWRHVEKAVLTVRPLGDEFVENYVESEWETIRHTVGCYAVEGAGVQLFSRIEGSHFTVLGMPLLPLLAQLRVLGIMPS